MADRHEIEIMIAKLSAAFPNWKVSPYTIQVYLEDLQDIDSETLDAAVKMCRTEPGRAFAPSTGEIRGAVGKLRGMANNVPSPFEAWQEFKHVVVSSLYTRSQKIEWSHPLVEKTANLIGLQAYGASNVDDEPSWRARFIQCYEQLQERAERENLLLPEVRGYIETNGGRFLAPVEQIKQLAKGMTK
jgi:hypothetical protein